MSTGQDVDRACEVGRRLRALAEVTGSLPRQLRELSADLQAYQGSLVAVADGNGSGDLDSSITAARFALSEATTAALALDRRIADAARHLAAVAADRA